jgi:hypothetical protein
LADIELVPSTRIGEIKKGFYEFQYTREVPEAAPNNGNNTGVNNVAQDEGEQQGTPKRERISHTNVGSRSAPPGLIPTISTRVSEGECSTNAYYQETRHRQIAYVS